MVQLKANGTEYQGTMKTTEQTDMMTKQYEGRIPKNCPTSVLLIQREDEVINGKKNGETTGLLRYGGKTINFFKK